MQRIKKGDNVRVISGNNSQKEGVILSINTKDQTAIVEGVNIVKKAQKPSQQNQSKGGIISKEAPIRLCKLALVVAKAPQGISKISYKKNKENKKIRMAKKTNSEIVIGKKK